MILIDTNVISELRKARPHGGVLAWYSENSSTTLRLSSITLYELQSGAERTRLQDPTKADALSLWITQVQQTMTVLPFGGVEARLTAYLMRQKTPALLQDAMIAATAIQNGLRVATRNTKDFAMFNVEVVNPFHFPQPGSR